jgi:hypothetical protein
VSKKEKDVYYINIISKNCVLRRCVELLYARSVIDGTVTGKVLFCAANIWAFFVTLYNKVIDVSVDEYDKNLRKKLFEEYLKDDTLYLDKTLLVRVRIF